MGAGLLLVGKHEGQVVELKCRLDLRQHGIGDNARIDGAKAHAFDQGLFITELTVGVQLDIEAASGSGLDALLEGAGANCIGVLRSIRCRPAELDNDFVLCNGRGHRHEYRD